MVDFPNGTPDLPDIQLLDPPGSAAGGLGLRVLINRANDNILALINEFYQQSEQDDNPIINGGPLIWPEGTSFPAIANAVYGPEMWRYINQSAAVHTLSQSTDVPAVASNFERIPFSILLDCTTADASIAAGDVCSLEYLMEGYYFSKIAQRQFTIRFWVKSPKSGIHCLALRNAGLDRSYVAEYTVNTANTWELKTITISASPVAGTWAYTTGIGLRIEFTLSAGSTFHTTPNAWNTGNFLATANQQNLTDSIANDFRVCGLKIKPGPYCGVFTQRPYTIEDILCRRYFEVLGTAGNSNIGAGLCNSATAADYNVPMVTKRVAPSSSAQTLANLFVYSSGGFFTATGISTIGAGTDLPLIRVTVASGLTAFGAAILIANTANVKLNARM